MNWDHPICGTDKARQLKFDTCVDRGNYWRMKDKSPFRESAKVMWLTEWSKVKVKCQGQGRKIVFFGGNSVPYIDCARGRCPAYFSDIRVPVHSVAGRSRLRSADHGDLIVPRVQTQRYGSRSFRVSGPTVWNSLPQNPRSSDISREQFKRGLKTWLFERAYV